MENAININHNNNSILPSFDGVLWVKNTTKWVISPQALYKSEKKLPTPELGNNGDYFAKYIRLYNYIKFSENFNTSVWYKYNTKLNKEPLISFPYNNCSKMTSTTDKAEHKMEYIFYNDLTSTYTFSIYVKAVELSNIAICLTDIKEQFGVNVLCDLEKKSVDVQEIDTEFDEIQYKDGNIITVSEGLYRIYVTAKFKTSLILKGIVKLLNKENESVFSTINDTYGLFVNGAQLNKSQTISSYTFTNGLYSSVAILDKLYKKSDNEWSVIPNIIYHFDGNPKDGMGSEGDIAVRDALITVAPAFIVGSSKNVKDSQKPNGTLFYDSLNDRIYVHTNRGNYYLMYKYPKNQTKPVAIAISLSQHIYQTYEKCGNASHFKGYNTGGNYNFWGNEFKRNY